MTFLTSNRADPFAFDIDTAKELGKDLADQYRAGDPFPHIAIDDFLAEEVVDYCLAHFPKSLDADGRAFNRDHERYKQSFHPDYLEPRLRSLFYAFNSRPFVTIIENITGIKGLIPDHYYLGGGFHEIGQGGHLSMHADFNHHKPMDLERRVNVLIYLNRNWKDAYGGQLELWRTDMSARVQSITPIANRCVIFTTTQESMHGNPNPVDHPAGETRKSIALYYYTSTWDAARAGKTTQFKSRPGTPDQPDWKVKTDEWISEYLPPFAARPLIRLKRRLAK